MFRRVRHGLVQTFCPCRALPRATPPPRAYSCHGRCCCSAPPHFAASLFPPRYTGHQGVAVCFLSRLRPVARGSFLVTEGTDCAHGFEHAFRSCPKGHAMHAGKLCACMQGRGLSLHAQLCPACSSCVCFRWSVALRGRGASPCVLQYSASTRLEPPTRVRARRVRPPRRNASANPVRLLLRYQVDAYRRALFGSRYRPPRSFRPCHRAQRVLLGAAEMCPERVRYCPSAVPCCVLARLLLARRSRSCNADPFQQQLPDILRRHCVAAGCHRAAPGLAATGQPLHPASPAPLAPPCPPFLFEHHCSPLQTAVTQGAHSGAPRKAAGARPPSPTSLPTPPGPDAPSLIARRARA